MNRRGADVVRNARASDGSVLRHLQERRMRVKTPKFVRDGKKIRRVDTDIAWPITMVGDLRDNVVSYKYFNEAKRASHTLTMVYGLGAVRRS